MKSPSQQHPPEGGAEGLVRPFLMTLGRTDSAVADLNVETMLEIAPGTSSDGLRFEMARVYDFCGTPISIAEVSARLGIPFGVSRVIAGDLIAEGRVVAHRTLGDADRADATLLTRVLEGIRRI